MRTDLHSAEGDLEKAAELSYGKLPDLKKQLEQEEEEVKKEDLSLDSRNGNR